MQTKFLKDVVGIIIGKQFDPLVDVVNGDKYVNEFIIAKKLGIEINQTRNLLYRLTDHGLVSSTRKKDARKGWYTYFWKIESVKSMEFLKTILEKRIGELKSQIKNRESNLFYVCETCHLEYEEETALLNNFTCDECGNVFTTKDNSKVVKDLTKELNFLEDQMKLLGEELENEKGKEEKKRMKVIVKEKKKKDDLAKEKRALRKAEKDKLKGTTKKLTKKATKKAIKKTAKKVAKKATKKAVKKTAKKVSKKIAKKSTKKSSKK